MRVNREREGELENRKWGGETKANTNNDSMELSAGVRATVPLQEAGNG
jgi:hypothetical protein